MEHVSFRGDKVFAPLMNSLLRSGPPPAAPLRIHTSLPPAANAFFINTPAKSSWSAFGRYTYICVYAIHLMVSVSDKRKPKNQTLCHFTMCVSRRIYDIPIDISLCRYILRQLANWLTLIDAIFVQVAVTERHMRWLKCGIYIFLFSFIFGNNFLVHWLEKKNAGLFRWKDFGERSSNCKLQRRQLTKISFA